MSVWSIAGKGTFEDLGLANLSRSRVNQGIDQLSFDAPGTAIDKAPLFAYREQVSVLKDNEPFFTGICLTIPRSGTPADERISYEIAGPWYYLEKCIYQQSWRLWNPDISPPALADMYKSRVILCQNSAGKRITSGEQIRAAISHAISKGAPIALGTVDPAINLPWDECKDISCAEVIIKMLRWSPDVACYFDYTQTPPLFHCRKKANMAAAAVSVSINAGSPTNTICVTPRHDLKIPGVVIRFEQTNDNDGVTYDTVVVQSAGDIENLETLVSTIELAGSKTVMQSQKIVTEAYPVSLSDFDWWKKKLPTLAAKHDNNAAKIEIERISASCLSPLPRILIEGTIQDWMKTKYRLTSEDDQVTADMDFSILDKDGNVTESVKNHIETLNFTATNATTKTYKKIDSITSGEEIPAGVATALYASWNELQCDGKYIYIQDECDGVIFPGSVINITGGPEAWIGLVQKVDEYIDEGRTTVTFGPAKHLGADDLVTLLRAFRTRGVAANSETRTSGQISGASTSIESSGPVPKSNSTTGGGEATKTIYRDKGTTYTAKISIDPTLVTAIKSDADVTLQPREIDVCTDDGPKKMIVLCSEPY